MTVVLLLFVDWSDETFSFHLFISFHFNYSLAPTMTTFKLFHTNKTQQLTTEMFSMAEMERKGDIFIANQCRFTALLAWKDDGR